MLIKFLTYGNIISEILHLNTAIFTEILKRKLAHFQDMFQTRTPSPGYVAILIIGGDKNGLRKATCPGDEVV